MSVFFDSSNAEHLDEAHLDKLMMFRLHKGIFHITTSWERSGCVQIVVCLKTLFQVRNEHLSAFKQQILQIPDQ
jgi:hypothetical protein